MEILSITPMQFDIRRRPVTTERTTGVWHVSTLLRQCGVEMGLIKEQEETQTIEGQVAAYAEQTTHGESGLLCKIALGLAWEDWVSQQVPGLEYHMGEIEWDGVYGSPDGIIHLNTNPYRIDEIKLTWKEAGACISKEWLWTSQVKAYCYILTQQLQTPVLNAALHVMHVNGFIRGSANRRARAGQPIAYTHQLQFTEKELESTWRLLMTAKSHLTRLGVDPM